MVCQRDGRGAQKPHGRVSTREIGSGDGPQAGKRSNSLRQQKQNQGEEEPHQ